MAHYIRARLLQAGLVLLGMTVVVFLLIRLLPGDPALVRLGPRATPEALAQMRENLGLQRSLPEQYARFLGGLLRGDIGDSLVSRQPVSLVIVERLPPTLALMLLAVGLTGLVSLPLALLAALRHDSWLDHLLRGTLVFAFAMPSFWVAIMLIQTIGLRLRWLPVAGWDDGVVNNVRHLLLPALTLALGLVPTITRTLRASLLEQLGADHVRTARAKGLCERSVLLRHVLRLALIPTTTLFGLQIGLLVGGSVVVESIFALPGVGTALVEAIRARDYPMVQGIVLLLTAAVILINLFTDLVVTALDPRIQHD